MRVWKFIWLRPLVLAAFATATIAGVVFLRGNSNASGMAEWIRRTAVIYAMWYVIFVVVAALRWKWAVPVQKKG